MTCPGSINHHDSIQAHTSDSFPLLSASVNRTASSSLVGKYSMLHPFSWFLNLLTCVLDHPTAAFGNSSGNISDSGHPSPVLYLFFIYISLSTVLNTFLFFCHLLLLKWLLWGGLFPAVCPSLGGSSGGHRATVEPLIFQ